MEDSRSKIGGGLESTKNWHSYQNQTMFPRKETLTYASNSGSTETMESFSTYTQFLLIGTPLVSLEKIEGTVVCLVENISGTTEFYQKDTFQ